MRTKPFLQRATRALLLSLVLLVAAGITPLAHASCSASIGYPTFGYFPYSALAGNTTNPSPYGYYNPYAMFLGCTNTYTASNFYVCR